MDDKVTFISLSTHGDGSGHLSVVEGLKHVPFEIKRIYYIYDVPADVNRGAHGHKELEQLIIPISGTFDVELDDGQIKKTFELNSPDRGLLLKAGLWRNLSNFSDSAVCLVLASQHYDESDYIRNYDEFVAWSRTNG